MSKEISWINRISSIADSWVPELSDALSLDHVLFIEETYYCLIYFVASKLAVEYLNPLSNTQMSHRSELGLTCQKQDLGFSHCL